MAESVRDGVTEPRVSDPDAMVDWVAPPAPELGHWYWVRFKVGIEKEWQPGQVRKNNGIVWVALIYSKAHYGLSHFDVGGEIKR